VLVSDYLADPEGGLVSEQDFSLRRYRPKLQLDYIGGFAAGVAGEQVRHRYRGGPPPTSATCWETTRWGWASGQQRLQGYQSPDLLSESKPALQLGWMDRAVPYLNIYNQSYYRPGHPLSKRTRERCTSTS
jgi:hypothetical protein